MKIGVKFVLGFLINVLLLAVICNFLIFKLHNITNYLVENRDEINISLKHDIYLHDLRLYSEILTQSAHNFAYTGDPKWKDSYFENKIPLEYAIQEAIKNEKENEKKILSLVETSAKNIIQNELQSIDLIEAGKEREAKDLLANAKYWKEKKIFNENITSYHDLLDNEQFQLSSGNFEINNNLLKGVQNEIVSTEKITIFFGMFSLVLALIMGLLISSSVSKPLIKLKKAANEIGKGHLNTPIDTNLGDEIGDLATSFSEMTSNLKRTTTSIDTLNKEVEERKIAEKKSFDQKVFLENVLESLTHSFYVIDAKTYRIVIANKTAKLGKLTPDSTCYSTVHKRNNPCSGEHACPLKEVLKTKKPFVTEHIHYDIEGNEKIMEVHGFPIFDEKGEVVQMIEYSLDISDRKRAEEETLKLQEQLLQAQKLESVGTMADGTAHNFNNILGVIRGYAEMALKTLDPDSRTYLDISAVIENTEKAKELTKKMLVLSRKNLPKAELIELQKVIYQTIDLFVASMAPPVQINKNIDKQPKVIMGDFNQLQQMFLNLWNNSYHALEGVKNGAISINVEETFLDQNKIFEYPDLQIGPYALVTIQDNGKGMDKEISDRIFEPFFTTKEIGKGTGLGLSIVHGIVKRHKGDIFVKSEPGKGAKFNILLPLAEKNLSL